MGEKRYENISHGLHENVEFITFFTLRGIMSTFNKRRHTLIKINTKTPIQNGSHNNKAPKIKIVRNKMDSLSRRYGIL